MIVKRELGEEIIGGEVGRYFLDGGEWRWK
jgi:hypothetical protein